MKRRQSKKRFCHEYIQPIINNWNLSPSQMDGVKDAFYKEMGGYGKKPNLMNSEDHKNLINTASRFISKTRKSLTNS
jgi:hypothetical protein